MLSTLMESLKIAMQKPYTHACVYIASKIVYEATVDSYLDTKNAQQCAYSLLKKFYMRLNSTQKRKNTALVPLLESKLLPSNSSSMVLN